MDQDVPSGSEDSAFRPLRRDTFIGCFSEIDNGDPVAMRQEEVNEVYQNLLSGSTYAFPPLSSKSHKWNEKTFEESRMVAFARMIRTKRQTRKNYINFLFCSLWFTLYVMLLYFERTDIGTCNALVESSLNSIVLDLRNSGVGSYGYTASEVGDVNFLQSQTDILSWINTSILDKVFVDAICGDGVCSETEFQGIDRFGCSSDCGRFEQLSKITVDLASFMKSSPKMNLEKWDIAHVIPTLKANPQFRWNIYSEAFRDYIFEEDLDEGTYTVALPDGKYSVEFFQYGFASSNVTKTDMYLNGYMVSSSIPERNPEAAQYSYGDYREFLSTAVSMMDAMYYYCYSSEIPRKPDKSEDMGLPDFALNHCPQECRTFFDKSFGIMALSSYGLQGTVSLTRRDGTSADLLAVPYCGVFPNGSRGLGGMRYVYQGFEKTTQWDTSSAASGAVLNMPLLVAAEVACSDNIDQSTVNNMFRSLGGDPTHSAPLASPPPPATTPLGRRAAAAGRAPHKQPPVALQPHGRQPHHRRLLAGGGGAQVNCSDGGQVNCSSQGNCNVSIVISGPSSADAGPGYEAGWFWNEVRVVEDCGGGWLAALDVFYTLNETGGPDCGGGGAGARLQGPVFTPLGSGAWFRAVVCAGSQVLGRVEAELSGVVAGPFLSFALSAEPKPAYAAARATVEDLREHICRQFDVGEFCEERVALTSSDDGDGVRFQVKALAVSNREAGEWRRRLVLNGSIFQSTESPVDVVAADAAVTVPVPLYKRHTIQQFCTSHYDCAVVAPARIGTNITEMTADDSAWGAGFCANYGSRLSDGRAPTCDYCQVYCMIEAIDSFDGICPEHCGNSWSGKYPPCVSAKKLQENYQCRDQFDFELKQYPEHVFDDPRKQKMHILRTITPSNFLIGGIILTQFRSRVAGCDAPAAFANFTKFHSIHCVDDTRDDVRPFGSDPVFAQSSELFDGKHLAGEFYNASSETYFTGRAGQEIVMPYGFFPHAWDSVNKQPKNESLVWKPSANEFKLYFDGRMSHGQAQRLLQFIDDGRFFDDSTSKLKVEMITYNPEVKLFTTCTFVFEWQRTGDISWDYAIQIVDVESHESWVTQLLTVTAFFCFACHVLLEFREIYVKFVSFRIWQYATSIFSMVDWANIIVQAIAWSYSFQIKSMISSFEMDESSYVLADPHATFRPFATDAEQEFKLLSLIDRVTSLGNMQSYQATFAGISTTLMMFKLITALDFQPKMGLLTSTLREAGSSLKHFLALCALVFFGHAVVGTLMFGTLYSGMDTFTDTCQTLMYMMIDFDPTQFHSQINHANTHSDDSNVQQGDLQSSFFIGSYMTINSYILFNVFVAILVAAYDKIARENRDAKSFASDVSEIFSYYMKLAFLPAKRIISDDELLKQIEKRIRSVSGQAWAETGVNTKASKVREALAPKRAILVGRGVAVERDQVKSLVEKVVRGKNVSSTTQRIKTFLMECFFASRLVPAAPPAHSISVVPPVASNCGGLPRPGPRKRSSFFLDDVGKVHSRSRYVATEQLMARLGTDMRANRGRISNQVYRLLEIEGAARMLHAEADLKRTLEQANQLSSELTELSDPARNGMYFGRYAAVDSLGAKTRSVGHVSGLGRMASLSSPIGKIVVKVMEAKSLPRMDVFNSCDAYCVLFLNEEGHDNGLADYMQYTSQQQFTRVIRSANPQWDEEFSFHVTPMTKSLVISVWDKEKVMEDELVGCVEIFLKDVQLSSADGFFHLRNAARAARLKDSYLRLQASFVAGELPVSVPSSARPQSPRAAEEVRETLLRPNGSMLVAREGGDAMFLCGQVFKGRGEDNA